MSKKVPPRTPPPKMMLIPIWRDPVIIEATRRKGLSELVYTEEDCPPLYGTSPAKKAFDALSKSERIKWTGRDSQSHATLGMLRQLLRKLSISLGTSKDKRTAIACTLMAVGTIGLILGHWWAGLFVGFGMGMMPK